MGGGLTLIGGAVVITLAITTDSKTTIEAASSIILIRGTTFVCKKALKSIDIDKAELLDFCGWCIAGLSIITILALAKRGIQPLVIQYNHTANQIRGITGFIDKIGKLIEKFAP